MGGMPQACSHVRVGIEAVFFDLRLCQRNEAVPDVTAQPRGACQVRYQRLGMRIVLVPAAVTTRITYIPGGARCATEMRSVVAEATFLPPCRIFPHC